MDSRSMWLLLRVTAFSPPEKTRPCLMVGAPILSPFIVTACASTLELKIIQNNDIVKYMAPSHMPLPLLLLSDCCGSCSRRLTVVVPVVFVAFSFDESIAAKKKFAGVEFFPLYFQPIGICGSINQELSPPSIHHQFVSLHWQTMPFAKRHKKTSYRGQKETGGKEVRWWVEW
jgi:hypothetical protein